MNASFFLYLRSIRPGRTDSLTEEAAPAAWILVIESIHDMNIRSMDLNLLVALDALVAERSVTRAGRRLGLSQPAVSNALRRLRQTLDDPVLVRTSQGMVPTPRASELIVPVRKLLAELEAVLSTDTGFDPSRAENVFRVTAIDHAFVVLVPPLARLLAESAPSIRLDFWPYRETTHQDLESGAVDAAILPGREHGRRPGFRFVELYDDHFDCLVRRDHPHVGRRLTLDTYLELGHVLASPRSRRGGLVDRALQQQGLARRVHVIVPHFAAAPFVVAQTDLVATLPRGVARPFARMLDLRVLPPPIVFEAGPWNLVWHERTLHDPAHAWLREQIQAVSTELRGTT
jgi:DNA-binding transcriptional LysR family regulator